CLQYKSVPFSF
nr:immunoglobulin light chain junction region [Macaca mulatta]